MQHIVSFIKSPIGYLFNFLATISCYIWFPSFMHKFMCWGCETFCLKDGTQDEPLF